MKTALTANEVSGLAFQIEMFIGRRLQDVHTENTILGLGLWGQGPGYSWLVVDLNAQSPNLWAQEKAPHKAYLKKNPIYLFLKSHVVNQKLVGVNWDQEYGRVLNLVFSNHAEIEIRLFPHGQNVIVKHEKKQVCWQKPVSLQKMKDISIDENKNSENKKNEIPLPLFLSERLNKNRVSGSAVDMRSNAKSILVEAKSGRVDSESCNFGSENIKADKENNKTDSENIKITENQKSFKKKLAQMERSIDKINQDIQSKSSKPFFVIAEWLKANGHMNVPTEFKDWIDLKKSFSWNMNHLYEQHKSLQIKIQNAQQRLQKLNHDLLEMKSIDINDHLKISQVTPSKDQILQLKQRESANKKVQFNARTLQIDSEVSVVVGKSGTDNLNILRFAQAWDIWLHLRDYPSAHAVLRRQKNHKINDSILFIAAQFLLKCHFGQKEHQYKGDKFEVIFTECRFVRPVKGDHHGRVTHNHTRSILVQKT